MSNIVPFVEIFEKVLEGNPAYRDHTQTSLFMNAHQRRGGQIIEFAFEADRRVSPPQRIMRANFISALTEWQSHTHSYLLLPKPDLVCGHAGIEFTPYDDQALLLPREVLAQISLPAQLHIEELRSTQRIG